MDNNDFITRSEFTGSMERIHKRVDEIKESQIRVEESAKRIESFGDKIFQVMYGKDEKGGLISLVNNLAGKITLQWAFIFFIITAIIGLAFWQFKC